MGVGAGILMSSSWRLPDQPYNSVSVGKSKESKGESAENQAPPAELERSHIRIVHAPLDDWDSLTDLGVVSNVCIGRAFPWLDWVKLR